LHEIFEFQVLDIFAHSMHEYFWCYFTLFKTI